MRDWISATGSYFIHEVIFLKWKFMLPVFVLSK